MRLTIAVAAAAFMNVVMADVAYPTLPMGDSVWVAGQSAPVTWRLMNPKFKTTLTVDLFTGDPAKQTLVKRLGVSPVGATALTVMVPANLNSDWYSLRIGDSWTHPFMIKGVDGTMPKGPMPGSAAANVAPKAGSSTGSSGAAGSSSGLSGSSSSASSRSSYFSAAPSVMAAAIVVAAAMAF